MATGLDKFNTSSDFPTRQLRKTQAFIDLVAPASELLIGNVDKWAIGWGTSFSAPLVAGIAGLMRSVDLYLGVPLTDGVPTTGSDIQAKAYNILTFTADKLPDFNNFSTVPAPTGYAFAQGFPPSSDPIYSGLFGVAAVDIYDAAYAGQSWQYNYLEQTNDVLKRSWAQRAGFGRVNAYRAVANSIPTIGAYSYSASATLDFTTNPTTNENGAYLMHFGAWKDASNKTLDAGGNIIPNQSPAWAYLNQGTTLVNGSGGATTLTVPNNCILAVDGLLMQTTPSYNNILTTSGSGKILITGYLQDVEVTGTTKVSDLIIYSSNPHNFSKINVGIGQTSEVYGVVHLQNNGQFVVNGGTLTLQPGGEIHMDGNQDFEIVGGTVTMQGSSTIASSSRQVIVDNGAHLIIAGLAPAYILATVHVKTGGILEITPGAELRLDHFLIDQNGTLQSDADPLGVIPGGRLTLNQSLPFNYCYGNFLFNGTVSSRCSLTGGVVCNDVGQTAAVVVQGSLSPSAVPLTLCHISYTDDRSVEILVKDAQKDPFYYDNFSCNSSFNSTLSQMLFISNSVLVPAATNTYLVTRALLMGCKFYDELGEVPTTHHLADGFNANNLQRLFLGSNYFYNMRTGCVVSNCPNTSYSSNVYGLDASSNVGPLVGGILENFSAAIYCANTVSHCWVGGITGISDLKGTLYDNTFGFDTSWSLATQVGGEYDLRNNTFSNYLSWLPGGMSTAGYAVWSAGKGNVINMRDFGTGPSRLLYGRNSFAALTGPATDMARGTSLYGPHNGDLRVQCGLNNIGVNSNCQILSLDFPYSLPVDNNSWAVILGTGIFKPCNVTGIGTPINVGATVSPLCGTETDPGYECTITGSVSTDPYPSSPTWFTIDSSSSSLKTGFWSASAMLLSDTNIVDVRRTKSQDELWSAMLVDSSAVYLSQALVDFDTVLYRPSTPAELASCIWVTKGHLEEMLGNTDSALVCYNTVLAGYHQYQDSISAFWGVMRVTIPSDTETAVIDSMRGAYILRVYADLRGMMDTCTTSTYKTSGKSVLNAFTFELAVHPNPTKNVASIEVHGMLDGVESVVQILDVTGKVVATLYDSAPLRQKSLSLMFNGSHLTEGTYFVRASSGNFVKTVRLVLVK